MVRVKDGQPYFDWMNEQATEPQLIDEAIERDAPTEIENYSQRRSALDGIELQPEVDKQLAMAQAELAEEPANPNLLMRVALVALLVERPDLGLRYLHRFSKRFAPMTLEVQLLRAIAFAQEGRWAQASQVVRQYGAESLVWAAWYLPSNDNLRPWCRDWLARIEKEQRARDRQLRQKKGERKPKRDSRAIKVSLELPSKKEAGDLSPERAELPTFEFSIPVSINITCPRLRSESPISDNDFADFRLRAELTHLELLQVFDELLCLPYLHNVDTYSFQIEAVRKVLKQFRGRVLLADEVGLGKTVEAGMVVKEYLLRGMVERVLILTPASLVKQWQEEMLVKFDIEFASSYDSLLRKDPEAFWSQPRVIASIATSRRAENLTRLVAQQYDLVIVDEAHHLKNRTTANWKLVDALQKRFLLLLSATPVQNSLVEIFNLLTLLKPGIFKTEKEFRATYMNSSNPRRPANSERLRELMRDVMIRNTRSLVDVRLPPRHASTIILDAGEQETNCYERLSRLTHESYREAPTQRRLSLRHLLAAAGSTPAAASEAIRRYVAKHEVNADWLTLLDLYESLGAGSKQTALCHLLRRNPDEKKIVFVHHRATLAALQSFLRKEGFEFSVFDGTMSGPEKDRAIDHFRDASPLLLCTESGGEGRNLQFCNTLINFDLPWNPMAIEQRIGRIHRIGQGRDVFIFNLVARNTLEEHILRILDEKINMFELVVGEIGAILGQLDEDVEFAELVFTAWMETTQSERETVFDDLGERLVAARTRYDSVKSLDNELFGDDFAAS